MQPFLTKVDVLTLPSLLMILFKKWFDKFLNKKIERSYNDMNRVSHVNKLGVLEKSEHF